MKFNLDGPDHTVFSITGMKYERKNTFTSQ